MLAELTPIRETRVGRELLEEGFKIGLEIGFRIGAERCVIKLIQARYPSLNESQAVQIRLLPLPALEQLAIAFLDFESFADLETWLVDHSE